MTDRELLESAARAAGMKFKGWINTEGLGDDGLLLTIEQGGGIWNPLTSDGDALRLAVKLRITPHIDSSMTDCEDCAESHLGDPYSATRRAITRAAAAIREKVK